MHDLISKFQLTSSADAHGKTNQQTDRSTLERFLIFLFFKFPCESVVFLVDAKPNYLQQEGKEFCTET